MRWHETPLQVVGMLGAMSVLALGLSGLFLRRELSFKVNLSCADIDFDFYPDANVRLSESIIGYCSFAAII